jgi:hypothetical protein
MERNNGEDKVTAWCFIHNIGSYSSAQRLSVGLKTSDAVFFKKIS